METSRLGTDRSCTGEEIEVHMTTGKKDWKEGEARLALNLLNEKVAAFFGQQPRAITISFVPFIERRLMYHNGELVEVKGTGEILANCDLATGHIQLIPYPSWPSSAIHELTHLYNPRAREKAVQNLARKCAFYLKSPQLAFGNPELMERP